MAVDGAPRDPDASDPCGGAREARIAVSRTGKPGNVDLAGRQYWETTWQKRTVLGSVNLKNYTRRRFDTLFNRYLPRKEGMRLMEAGCAQSSWLPYFHLRFGYEIAGLDYSETGCKKASENLSRHGVTGTILCRDFLEEQPDLKGQFDVVFSYGVIEHFSQPETVLTRFHRFLKPDGLVVTIIPNMRGITGWLQRLVNRPVYDIHVPLTPVGLQQAHRAAGFQEVSSGYLGSVGTEVVNYPVNGGIGMRAARKLLKLTSKASWILFRAANWHPESVTWSPYVYYIGRCKEGG
jgi:2-polyprenyl-3-methyl-5-hydroxy-6-metoxy-1,4-benzoquinol methylase